MHQPSKILEGQTFDTITNPLGADGTGATSSIYRVVGGRSSNVDVANLAATETLLAGASDKVEPQTTAAQQKKTVAFQAPGTEHESTDSTFVDAFAGADGSSFPGLTGLLAAQADSTTTAADGDAGDCAGQDDMTSSVHDDDEETRSQRSRSQYSRGGKHDLTTELEDIKIKTMYNLVEDVTVDVGGEAVE
jgi:hypothetical protein